jgi:CRISPR-associated endonuclease/helicase Cas3
VPDVAQKQTREEYGYRLESYERHIELVHQVFVRDWLAWLTAVSARIEKAYGWQLGIMRDMAELVVCLHDVGKLSEGWQKWACDWQTAVGTPLPRGTAAAHTDFDPTNERHKELNRKVRGKRPTHAVESAYAALPILMALLPDKDHHMPLLRAAFTAISRHHGPFTSQPSSYKLEIDCHTRIQATAVRLPPALQYAINSAALRHQLAYNDKTQRGIEKHFLIQPDNDQDVICYIVLVRALRFADQEGTKLGNR